MYNNTRGKNWDLNAGCSVSKHLSFLFSIPPLTPFTKIYLTPIMCQIMQQRKGSFLSFNVLILKRRNYNKNKDA